MSTTDPQQVRVALIGTAHIHTPGFVKRLNDRRDVVVTDVWDHQPDRAARWAQELRAGSKAVRVATTVEAALAEPGLDAVIICSETDRHEALVGAAAAAGKAMFVEKPLGLGAGDAYRMAEVVERAGVRFQTGYFSRSQGITRYLKDLVGAGTLGQITRVRMSNGHAGALNGWFDSDYRWMADPAVAGCGAFGDLGTHRLDIMMWILGMPECVTAALGPGTGRYGDCDEFGEGLLQFSGGSIGVLAGSWVDVADPVPIMISGTKGHAYVRDGRLYIRCVDLHATDGTPADGATPWTDVPADLPHAFELFLDALHGADVPLVGVREAAQRSAVVEALYHAAATATWVKPV